ncbi:MAG TPA: toll/interleukin-1 receptor domain-containing protein [Streptosporangiaceae bacterium]|nr:toll/interleukin-1 receptor domain-containing protein [Streptosporangiaceae bacterium]
MTGVEVDYNERDDKGRVIGGVSAEQLLALHEGDAVTLYDPVDHLSADATVAWIEADALAVGFDVDWTSFQDEDLSLEQPSAGAASVEESARTSPGYEMAAPGAQTKPEKTLRQVRSWLRRTPDSKPSTPGVFISYRHEDADLGRMLRGQLAQRLAGTPVFTALEIVRPGGDFADIDSALRSSAFFVVLIGPRWLGEENKEKQSES